jgi:hypothetical protein
VVNGHQEQPGFLDLADVTRGMSAREMLARAMDARSGMGVARWGFSLRCLARRHIGSPYASHPPARRGQCPILLRQYQISGARPWEVVLLGRVRHSRPPNDGLG